MSDDFRGAEKSHMENNAPLAARRRSAVCADSTVQRKSKGKMF